MHAETCAAIAGCIAQPDGVPSCWLDCSAMATSSSFRPLILTLPRRGVQCAGVLAKALKGAWRPYAKDLIEPMAMTGLTDTLVRALKVRMSPSTRVVEVQGLFPSGSAVQQ